MKNLLQEIFNIQTDKQFNKATLDVFKFQAKTNPVYKEYLQHLNVDICSVDTVEKIPFLPIEFFKSHKVICENTTEEIVFYSSGTTGMVRSKHYVADTSVYKTSFINSFNLFYGDVSEYCVVALLPSYFEQKSSSLLYMTDEFLKRSKIDESGYYLDDTQNLLKKLEVLESKYSKIILLGVTYALLDAMDAGDYKLKHTIIMETGGMKGRRAELTKEELHAVLSDGYGVESIHSEYGMTELLSQAYSFGEGVFNCPPWMKIIIRDIYDPLSYVKRGSSGGINVIDLANIYSCSFIETKDLGIVNNDGFKVLGRFDNSDVRGCNMLVAD